MSVSKVTKVMLNEADVYWIIHKGEVYTQRKKCKIFNTFIVWQKLNYESVKCNTFKFELSNYPENESL